MSSRSLTLPINRVEGDLEVSVEISDNRVVAARIAGTMFRGFEQMMKGRGLLDGLVITPRICGICSTSHLYAAALALDRLHTAKVPDNAIRMRNLTHIAEHLQSDLRHAILMFAVDFAHDSYRNRSFFAEAERCYAPLRGESAISTVRATRSIVEIVALIGGQWPHSSFMVPGGIVSTPSPAELRKCRLILEEFSQWYQHRILGGPLDAWQQVQSAADLEAWCGDPAHAGGDLARLRRIAAELRLDQGAPALHFISGGALPLPATEATPGNSHLLPGGFWSLGKLSAFEPGLIREHLASSFYREDSRFESPFQGRTHPDLDKKGAYSWVKAPRYAGKPAETGALAELLCAGHPLLTDLVTTRGLGPWARELARLVRPAVLLPAALRWLRQTDPAQGYYIQPAPVETVRHGLGLVEASRGLLGHWLEANGESIENYQIITPTSWNASPRDKHGRSGPMEQALLGIEVEDPDNPLELGHLVRSFDPCLVCAVHSLHKNGRSLLRLGSPL